MARKRLGELLLERRAISPAQLEAALATQRTTRARLGSILVEQGSLSESALVQALSEALHLPQVDLAHVQPEWAAVHALRARFCEQHELFPYALEAQKGRKLLSVALADPLNVPALEEIEFTTGFKVVPRLATRSALRSAILRWYHKVDPDQATGVLVQAGGAALGTFDDEAETTLSAGEPLSPEEIGEGEVVLGEPLAAPSTESPAGRKGPSPALTAISRDLEYLVGGTELVDPVEELERKFWALLRIMARKGLLTSEEFKQELDTEQ
jgi:hypothetical protein